MMVLKQVNYIAVVVSAVIYFIIGSLWYSKVLFAEAWAKEKGHKMEGDKPAAGSMAVSYGGMLITEFLYVLGIAVILLLTGKTGIVEGIKVALFVIILFNLPLNAGTLLFPSKPRLFFIDWGYQAIGALISAIILSLWR